MKKMVGTILLLMAAKTTAFADSRNPQLINCHLKENSLFSIQLELNEPIKNDTGLFSNNTFVAKFTTLHGPRLVGVNYSIEVTKATVSTRLKVGYSYAAQIPDGSELYIEDTVNVGHLEFDEKSFTGQLRTLNNGNLYFDCAFQN